MATIKLVNEDYKNKNCIHNLIHYCFNQSKTEPYLCGVYGANPYNLENEMLTIKRLYGKEGGRQVRHFIVSFRPGETVAALELQTAWAIAGLYADKFQIFFAIHNNTPHVHIHFVFNTVSYVDGRVYSGSHADFYRLKNFVNNL